MNNGLYPDILYQKVFNVIKNYARLVLAFSGGLDSSVLLSILANLRAKNTTSAINNTFTFRAIHINHCINIQSNKWANFCVKKCKNYGIKCTIIKINCKNIHKNIESSIRDIRYRELWNNIKKYEVLLTAHHLDDQIETFLLALKRGSGPKGLSAMSIYSNNHGILLRPLLSFTKKELQEYANINNIHWIIDNSNEDIRFDRNFLRMNIIPILIKRWPWLYKTITRSLCIYAEQEKLLDYLLNNKLISMINDQYAFFYKELVNMPKSMQYALIRRWLTLCHIKLLPSYKQLDIILKEVAFSRPDRIPILKLNNYLIRRFRNALYVLPMSFKDVLNNKSILWNNINEPLKLSKDLGLLICNIHTITGELFRISNFKQDISDLLKTYTFFFKEKMHLVASCQVRSPYINEDISVRFGYVPGLLHIVGKNHRKSLKKLWQEFNIPPWLRSRIPLLFYNENLIAALGVFITYEGQVNNKKNTLHNFFWLKPKSIFFVLNKNI